MDRVPDFEDSVTLRQHYAELKNRLHRVKKAVKKLPAPEPEKPQDLETEALFENDAPSIYEDKNPYTNVVVVDFTRMRMLREIKRLEKKLMEIEPSEGTRLAHALALIRSAPTWKNRIRVIQMAVARAWDITVPMLVSESRRKEVTRPRMVAMNLCHRMLGASLKQIGSKFNRDHTTVLHAVRTMDGLVSELVDKSVGDAVFAEFLAEEQKEVGVES